VSGPITVVPHERDHDLGRAGLRNGRDAIGLGIERVRRRLGFLRQVLQRRHPFVESVQEQPRSDQDEGARDDELELVAAIDVALADAAVGEQLHLLVHGRDLVEQRVIEPVREGESDDRAEGRGDGDHDAPRPIRQEPAEGVDGEVTALARGVARAEQRGPDGAVQKHIGRDVQPADLQVQERGGRVEDGDQHHHTDDHEAQARFREQDAPIQNVQRPEEGCRSRCRGGSCLVGGGD
jgi:hypothetical protein